MSATDPDNTFRPPRPEFCTACGEYHGIGSNTACPTMHQTTEVPMNPTDADTEAGRGEGRDLPDLDRPDYAGDRLREIDRQTWELIRKLSAYAADSPRLPREVALAWEDDLCEHLVERLRQSDPGRHRWLNRRQDEARGAASSITPCE